MHRAHGKPRISRVLRLLAPVAALWLLQGVSPGLAAEPVGGKPEGGKPKGADALEKDLVAAMGARQFERAAELVSALAAAGETRGFEAIIKYALTGADYELEKHAGAILAASMDPKVRAKVFEGIRKNPQFKTRIILLAVAARMDHEPRVLEAIHGALKDPSKPVVFSALSWIREFKRPESVDAVLPELEARERKAMDRVYFDMLRTLKHLTGQDLNCAVDWRNFWEAQKAGYKNPPRPAGGGRTSVYRSDKFFSVSVDSDRVLFVIDVSGSMTETDPLIEEPSKKKAEEDPGSVTQGKTVVVKKPEKSREPKKKGPPPASRQRLARVKEELIRVVDNLKPSTCFGILSFSHELKYLWASRTLKSALPENKAAAIQWVRGLQANGATRTDLALEEALSIPEVDCIFLLTDGAPKGLDNLKMPIEPILGRAKELNRFVKARIHTISFQQIRDKNMVRFCRELSLQNDGGEPTLLP